MKRMNLRVALAAAFLLPAFGGAWADGPPPEQAAAVACDAVAHGLAGLGGGDGPVHALHRLFCVVY